MQEIGQPAFIGYVFSCLSRETWDVILSRTAAVQYLIWSVSCWCPFQVMWTHKALLYEWLLGGLLGTVISVVLLCLLDERSWVASAKLRAAGLMQTVPSWEHGILLDIGEFSSRLAGFVKFFLFCQARKKKNPSACLDCGELVVLEHWVCSGARWQFRLIKGRGWTWHTASLSRDECCTFLGCKVSSEAGCTN